MYAEPAHRSRRRAPETPIPVSDFELAWLRTRSPRLVKAYVCALRPAMTPATGETGPLSYALVGAACAYRPDPGSRAAPWSGDRASVRAVLDEAVRHYGVRRLSAGRRLVLDLPLASTTTSDRGAAVLLTRREIAWLSTRSPALVKAYVCGIRPAMDYGSGTVGHVCRISYASIAARIAHVPDPGSRASAWAPGPDQIRALVAEGERHGGLARLGPGSGRGLRLVLPLALTDRPERASTAAAGARTGLAIPPRGTTEEHQTKRRRPPMKDRKDIQTVSRPWGYAAAVSEAEEHREEPQQSGDPGSDPSPTPPRERRPEPDRPARVPAPPFEPVLVADAPEAPTVPRTGRHRPRSEAEKTEGSRRARALRARLLGRASESDEAIIERARRGVPLGQGDDT